MKKFIILFVLFGAIFFGVKTYVQRGKPIKEYTRERVEYVLDGITKMRSGTKGDEYIAVCMWFDGSLDVKMGETAESMTDQFDIWRREGNINLYIDEYTIDNIEKSGKSAIVSGTINGEPYKIKVTKKEKIEWLQTPQLEE